MLFSAAELFERLHDGERAARYRRELLARYPMSRLVPNVDRRTWPAGIQHDFALTLRFDVNRYWLIKAEGHYMRGTAGLSASLNGNLPLSALTPDWALFALKTTAYF